MEKTRNSGKRGGRRQRENGEQLGPVRYRDLCGEVRTRTIIRRSAAAIMEAVTDTVLPRVVSSGQEKPVPFEFLKRRAPPNNEAFVSHAVLHGRARTMAHDQRATLSNRIREHQVILFPVRSGRS